METATGFRHAEVEQVWPRDGHIRVVGRVVGHDPRPGAGTLTLTSRYRPHVVLRFPARLEDGRFEAVVGVGGVARATAGMGTDRREIWDLRLEIPGGPEPLRVGRHLDDIPNKKKVMTFPAQTGETAEGPLSVKPYYTDWQNLSVLCRRDTQ
jgi:hypothetical protein